MVKSGLIRTISVKMNLPYQKAETAVESFFSALIDGLATGNRVEIRGFGTFSRRDYPSYIGRNPKTGESVNVAPKVMPFFKAGKEMKDAVNSK